MSQPLYSATRLSNTMHTAKHLDQTHPTGVIHFTHVTWSTLFTMVHIQRHGREKSKIRPFGKQLPKPPAHHYNLTIHYISAYARFKSPQPTKSNQPPITYWHMTIRGNYETKKLVIFLEAWVPFRIETTKKYQSLSHPEGSLIKLFQFSQITYFQNNFSMI